MPFKKGKSKKTSLKNTKKAGKKGASKSKSTKARKDFDGDGKLETPEKEFKGSRDKAIKKAKGAKAKSKLKESFDNFIKNILENILLIK